MIINVKEMIKLIYPIDCWRESIHDSESLKNLNDYSDLVYELVDEIISQYWSTKDDYRYSAKE